MHQLCFPKVFDPKRLELNADNYAPININCSHKQLCRDEPIKSVLSCFFFNLSILLPLTLPKIAYCSSAKEL